MIATASVTVVIPCFRCSQTLERAVLSVAGQTVLPLELVLVDDGSGGETRSLMVQLQSRYELGWIRLVLLDTNAGAASARNAGWNQARGDYVAFLDADDAWHPQKIELQVQFMNAYPDVVVSGHGHRQVQLLPGDDKYGGSVDFRQVSPLHIILKNPFVTPSFMVRRNIQNRFLPGRRFMEDHLFLMQISAAGCKVSKANAPLAYIFKPIFGESGLSADLLQMQRFELENYRLLGKYHSISEFWVKLLLCYSWLKFIRRYLIVKLRSLAKSDSACQN